MVYVVLLYLNEFSRIQHSLMIANKCCVLLMMQINILPKRVLIIRPNEGYPVQLPTTSSLSLSIALHRHSSCMFVYFFYCDFSLLSNKIIILSQEKHTMAFMSFSHRHTSRQKEKLDTIHAICMHDLK